MAIVDWLHAHPWWWGSYLGLAFIFYGATVGAGKEVGKPTSTKFWIQGALFSCIWPIPSLFLLGVILASIVEEIAKSENSKTGKS